MKGDRWRGLVPVSCGDRDPVGVEHPAVSAHAGAVDVEVARAGVDAGIHPGGEEVRAVEGERGKPLIVRRSRDRDAAGVEYGAGRAHAGGIDVVG